MFSFNNLLSFLVIGIVLYVVYVCYFTENFTHHEHHHSHHHKHHHATHHAVAMPTTHITVEAEPVIRKSEVWGVNSANQIWKAQTPCENNNCNWINVPGALKQVSHGEHDVWGTGPGPWAPIWKCNKPCNGEWTSVPGSLAQVSVGKDVVWGVNDNGNIYYCSNTPDAPCTGNWVNVSGGLKNVSVL